MSPVEIADRVSSTRADAGEAKAVSSDVGEREVREITMTRLRSASQYSLSSLRRVGRPPELPRSIDDCPTARKAISRLLFTA
jgi:hypothetical protein